jgi:bifunctional pyridoxal-dependent enzyme with beta-cystathionase and maltose regulon repressor activities
LDVPVERRSIDEASLKWGRYRRPYLQSPSDPDAPAVSLPDEVLPMWVADMDFRSPPCVLQALHDRVAHGLFGYTAPSERLNRNVVVSVMTKAKVCFHTFFLPHLFMLYTCIHR